MTNDNPNPEDSIDSEPFEMEPESVEYPPVLRLTANPQNKARDATRERLQEWQDGETVPHVINFQDPGALRKLLTVRRIELLRNIMDAPPDSIRALADRLDRGVKETADDVNLLAEYEIVYFEQDGRAKQPYVPYETVKIEVEVEATTADETDRALASG
jgi:predicted transcriptional regulator